MVLWAKLLQRMVYDYLNGMGSRDIKTLKLANDAKVWLFDSTHEHSLAGMCQLLDLDLAEARTHILTLYKQDAKKAEFMICYGEDDADGVRTGPGEGIWGRDWMDLPDWTDWGSL